MNIIKNLQGLCAKLTQRGEKKAASLSLSEKKLLSLRRQCVRQENKSGKK